LEHIDRGNNFLTRTPIAQKIREKIDKWDCIKLKSFSTAKETVTRPKRQPKEWEKIIGRYTTDKELLTRILREIFYSVCYCIRI
jgi:hypothetical protein